MTIKTYSELIQLETYKERFDYLKLNGIVGVETFGYERLLNQLLYNSGPWKTVRRDVIIRDNGCDLALEGFDIHKYIVVHHIDPITPENIKYGHPKVFDLDNLVCTSDISHKAIHYGNYSMIQEKPIVRTRNDMCPWR